MKDPQAKLAKAVEDCDLAGVIASLDAGATGWGVDHAGTPFWFTLLRLILYPEQAQDQADILQALFDAGLVADRDVACELGSMIEPQNPLCAPVLLSAVPPGDLPRYEWPKRDWWRERIAEHQAATLGRDTPAISSHPSSPRL